jgi:hypothetical protein
MGNWYSKIKMAKYTPPFEISSYNNLSGELSGFFRQSKEVVDYPYSSGKPYLFYNISPDNYENIKHFLKSPYTAGKAIRMLHAAAEERRRRLQQQEIEQSNEEYAKDWYNQQLEEDIIEQDKQEKIREGNIFDELV